MTSEAGNKLKNWFWGPLQRMANASLLHCLKWLIFGGGLFDACFADLGSQSYEPMHQQPPTMCLLGNLPCLWLIVGAVVVLFDVTIAMRQPSSNTRDIVDCGWTWEINSTWTHSTTLSSFKFIYDNYLRGSRLWNARYVALHALLVGYPCFARWMWMQFEPRSLKCQDGMLYIK